MISNREEAREVVNRVRATMPGAILKKQPIHRKVEIDCRNGCTKLDDGTWSEMFEVWSVVISIENAETGNLVVRTVQDVGTDLNETWKDILTEMDRRRKKTLLSMETQAYLDSE